MKISVHSSGGSSPFSACFHPSTTANNNNHPSPSPSNPSFSSGDLHNPTTTFLYHTQIGVFSLSWSQSFLCRTLHLNFHTCNSSNCYIHSQNCHRDSIPFTFRLQIKPFTFWRKHGSKTISHNPEIRVFWDFTKAKFGLGPDPESGFYIAVFVSGELGLLVGDYLPKHLKQRPKRQILVSRIENLFGNKFYCTKIKIKGKVKEISIEVKVNEDINLRFSVDNIKVLQIRRLQWNFRGNAKIVIDGVTMQVSWDVYNWLFGNRGNNNRDRNNRDENIRDKGPGVFLLRFENQEMEGNEVLMLKKRVRDGVVLRKKKSGTASFGCPVMEWSTCNEEEERSFGDKSWFSLIIYTWRRK